VFLLVLSLTLAGATFAVWRLTVRAAELPRGWRRGLAAALTALTALVPVALPFAWWFEREVAAPWAWAAFVWMGLLFYLLLFGLLFRSAAGLAGRLGPTDPERRRFLGRASAAATAVGATATGAWGLREAGRLVVEEVELAFPHLPPAFDGFTVVQISDLHVGPLEGGAWLGEVVDRCNALAPDLVAVTGDVIDGPVDLVGDEVAPLAGLRARHGVHLCAGNHEYYSGIGAWLAEFERLGLRVLRNERVAIERDGARIDLAGVHDLHGGRFGPEHAPDLDAALGDRDPARLCLLLAHQPAHVDEAAAHGVDLVLAGHTHGGQLWPFGALTRLVQPYLAGTHRHTARTWIHVNRGTGCWGPPMRVGASAEITRLVLRRGEPRPA
jgi:predicted MPP superfamily phosphohydrolase